MRARREPPPLRGYTIEIPVRFAECDSYGVVWHGHYALYLEEVRDRLTSRFGFTPATALALGYRVPVTRMEIRYRAPARPDETIRATARSIHRPVVGRSGERVGQTSAMPSRPMRASSAWETATPSSTCTASGWLGM